MLQLASWRLNRIKNLFVTDDDGLDKKFSIGEQRGQYFICPSRRMKLENLFDDLAFFMYLGIPEIYFDNFFEVADEIGKNI